MSDQSHHGQSRLPNMASRNQITNWITQTASQPTDAIRSARVSPVGGTASCRPASTSRSSPRR